MARKGLTPIELMNTQKGKEISWEFFLDYKTSTEVSKIVYPKLWKGISKPSWTVPYVNKLQRLWKKEDFFEKEPKTTFEKRKAKGNSTRKQPIRKYILSLKLLFLHLESLRDKKGNPLYLLNANEKKDIELLFNNPNIRKFIYTWMKTKNGFEKNVIDALIEFVYVFFTKYGEPKDENENFLKDYFKFRPDLREKYDELNIHQILAEKNQEMKSNPSGLPKLRAIVKDINNKFICRW